MGVYDVSTPMDYDLSGYFSNIAVRSVTAPILRDRPKGECKPQQAQKTFVRQSPILDYSADTKDDLLFSRDNPTIFSQYYNLVGGV